MLLELKRRHGFLLMEDACPATGSRYRGGLVGTFGEMSSFSFYFGHHIRFVHRVVQNWKMGACGTDAVLYNSSALVRIS